MRPLAVAKLILLLASNCLAAEELDCDERARLGHEVAVLRDRGLTPERVYEQLLVDGINNSSLHNTLNTVFHFFQYTPAKIHALEQAVCKKELAGQLAGKYKWTSVSGVYEDGVNYSGASISDGDNAIYVKFQKGNCTFAVKISGANRQQPISLLLDGQVAISGSKS